MARAEVRDECNQGGFVGHGRRRARPRRLLDLAADPAGPGERKARPDLQRTKYVRHLPVEQCPLQRDPLGNRTRGVAEARRATIPGLQLRTRTSRYGGPAEREGATRHPAYADLAGVLQRRYLRPAVAHAAGADREDPGRRPQQAGPHPEREEPPVLDLFRALPLRFDSRAQRYRSEDIQAQLGRRVRGVKGRGTSARGLVGAGNSVRNAQVRLTASVRWSELD